MFRRNFLSLPIFGFLSFNKSKEATVITQENETLELWEQECVDWSYRLTPKVMTEIDREIAKWLKASDEPTTSLWFEDENDSFLFSLQFIRSKVNIKTCANVWEVWHIATSSAYPKMISQKIKQIGINDCQRVEDGFKMPNEIRSCRYSS